MTNALKTMLSKAVLAHANDFKEVSVPTHVLIYLLEKELERRSKLVFTHETPCPCDDCR